MDTLALPSMDDLVPPAELIFDGGDRANFIASAHGAFLWNVLAPRCGLKPDSAVLDIGFGNGRHARVLTRYLEPAGRYAGFDIVRPAVEWCQRAYAPLPNFRFDYANIRSDWYNPEGPVIAAEYVFPYGDGEFDVAFATSLFTHLDPAESANYLRETARVLRPGGRFAFSAFLAREGRHQRDDIQDRRFTRASATHHLIDHDNPSRGVAHDEDAFRAAIEAAGLVVAEINFGKWANAADHMGGFQDLIIAVKPGD